MKYYIYLTTNHVNGMKYIGKHHGELDNSYLGSGKLLKLAIKKHGKSNFSKDILFVSESEEENCEKEKYFIAKYDAVNSPEFYNIHEGGKGGDTFSGISEEEKAAIRTKLSLLNSGEGNGMYGKHHSEEAKKYLSYWAEFCRDNSVYRTEDFRQKMSALTSGENNGMYGKHHTEESKAKMSANSKGKTTGEKNGMYGKKGDKALNGKKIEMYDENHNLVRTFNAKTAVLEFLGMKGHTQLDRAIKEGTLYKGYYWKQIKKQD